MHLIEDTKQKISHHELKHSDFSQMGVNLIRNMLPFGDYAYPPTISVDTKENMQEIAANLSADHERFRKECIKAKDAGCHLYILVETEWDISDISEVHKWENPRTPMSQKAVSGAKLQKTMETMQRKYGVKFMFCHPSMAAEYIIRILNGEFEDE